MTSSFCAAFRGVSAFALPPVPSIGEPAFPGVIALAVAATEPDRRIVRVRETIPVGPGHLVPLHPQ